jgi:hypothetical protein
MFIKNLPKKVKRYIVYRVADGAAWYYGTWDDEIQAQNIAELVGGAVYDTEG